MNVLSKLFEQHFHLPPLTVQAVQGGLGGSGRRIVRLANEGARAIGVQYEVHEENRAFVGFSRHFRRLGLPVPEIYCEDEANGAYLEEDLGDLTLFQFLNQHREGARIDPIVADAYRRVVEVLPRFQVQGSKGLDYSLCYPRASFDAQSIAWDLNYFKYYFLRLAGVAFNEQALEDDFATLTRFLLEAEAHYFLYRDFQSRNIMLVDGRPYFLDYQGGRRGALQYDIASLLFDGKADLPPELRAQLLDHYLDVLGEHLELDRERFLGHYYGFVYVRILQALGAYGFRGFYERKTHFLSSVPFALKNLRWLLHNVELPIELPALTEAFRQMVGSEKLQQIARPQKQLTVEVASFSFHRGPVEDPSGNGGGYVFDARCLPNPGREEQFKKLTGRDQPVIDYLVRESSVHQYLAAALQLIEGSVANYQQRGFENLMVSFGCTGGQHRSVYLAEQVARRLEERGGLKVVLRHREQEKWPR